MKRIPFEEIANKKYGKLTIIMEADESSLWKRNMLCRCDCGNEIIVSLSNLRQRHTLSCGCYLPEWIRKHKTTHNLRKHSIYRIWAGMKSRCKNPRASHFEHYGGRGIKVCDEWINDFVAFYNWAITNGWQQSLEIDRINNDGNYEPSNCRFVTHQINSQNRIRKAL